MWAWISSWFRSAIPVEKEKEVKYEGPPVYPGPIINLRVLPDQYKVNDKWWGTTLALKETPGTEKDVASAENV